MLLTMGNREDLIAGAKRCLIEKGYAHTTARDIAAASGVSLAAIGYHFGSKDALMNQAVYESVGEWANEVQRALTDAGALDAEPLRRFESVMGQTIESFGGAGHGLWAAQLELMSLLEHNEELRRSSPGSSATQRRGWRSSSSGSTRPRTRSRRGWPARSCTPCSSASW